MPNTDFQLSSRQRNRRSLLLVSGVLGKGVERLKKAAEGHFGNPHYKMTDALKVVTDKAPKEHSGPWISYDTVKKVFEAKKPTDKTSIERVFHAFGLRLRKSDFVVSEAKSSATGRSKKARTRTQSTQENVSDWVIQELLTRWKTAPNGLQYRIARMQHKYQERIDRGKCYDLELLSTDERERIESRIRRHDRTLRALAKVPGIPENRTVLETNARWWIIDEWIEGKTLTTVLNQGPLSTKTLPDFARGLITIIQAMHTAEVILRDLCPDAITIGTASGQPFVTDFEMAKLISRKSTVSAGAWERSSFLAPELVEGEESSNPQVDFYSWAMVVVAAGTAELNPTPKLAAQWITSKQLPKSVSKIFSSCLHPSWRKRPKAAKEILRALTSW